MTLAKLMAGGDGDQESARWRMLAALLATGGNAVQAADVLKVSHRTLCRYIERLDMHADLTAIRTATKKNQKRDRERANTPSSDG